MLKGKHSLMAILIAALSLSIFSCKKDRLKINSNSLKQNSLNKSSSFSDPLYVSLYAGGLNYGNLDGTLLEARFASPFGITATAQGDLYVTDLSNSNVRKISGGYVSHLVFKNLSNPFAMTTGLDGKVYFIEGGKQHVREIANDEILAPLDICKCTPGGPKTPFVFTTLFSVAAAADGTIFLVDAGTNSIIKRTTNGMGSVLTGGTAGYKDGNITEAQFNVPVSIAIDSNNNLYVADSYNFAIRKITPDGIVSTVAGGTAGYKDGIGTDAQFNGLQSVYVVDNNTLLVTENYNIRRIDLTTGQVTTIAGGSTAGFTDAGGPALSVKFGSLTQLATYDGAIYVVEEGTRRIFKIAPQ